MHSPPNASEKILWVVITIGQCLLSLLFSVYRGVGLFVGLFFFFRDKVGHNQQQSLKRRKKKKKTYLRRHVIFPHVRHSFH